MQDKVREYIRRYKMLEEKDKVVLGVSGGADSVALFEVMANLSEEMALSLYVVHVNHGIRKEAGEDAAYVEKLCEDRGIPFYLFLEDIPAMARRERLSEEEAGRIYRYQCFCEICEKTGAKKLAVAHHLDDQAETVLFHLARGTDLSGLAGMRPITGLTKEISVIRPLLCVRKAEITSWLAGQGISWQEDITNGDSSYARNRIRNEVIPQLEALNEHAAVHIAQLAGRAAEYDTYIGRQARGYIEENNAVMCSGQEKWRTDEKDTGTAQKEQGGIIKSSGEQTRGNTDKNNMGLTESSGAGIRIRLNRSDLLKQERVLIQRVLYELLAMTAGAKKDLTGEHVRAVEGLLEKQSGKQVHLPYGVTAKTSYEWLIVERKTEHGQQFDAANERDCTAPLYEISVDQLRECGQMEFFIPEGMGGEWLKAWQESFDNSGEGDAAGALKIVLSVKPVHEAFMENDNKMCINFEKFEKNYTKYFDCDTIGNTLYIRFPEREDYITIDRLGHRKKIGRYFKDTKLSAEERSNQLLLASEHEVLWVLGKRRCEAHLIGSDTNCVLEVRLEPQSRHIPR